MTGLLLIIGTVLALTCAAQAQSHPVASAGRRSRASASAELVLADGGRSDYRIVIPQDASPAIRYAAEELQDFLKQISGATLPITTDREPLRPRQIILGHAGNAHLRQLTTRIDWPALGEEGYVLRAAGQRLIIAGSGTRGTLYGVYGLLQDHLGCRWFAPQVSHIPTRERLVIPAALDEMRVPALEYRDPFVFDCYDADWSARNRMNGSQRLTARHGGGVKFGGSLFVHTFYVLLPPERHFRAHPEYYSLIDGKRTAERGQLCCTNEDVIRLVTDEVRQRMRQDPGGFVFSISQNDWGNYCQCPACQAMAKDQGTQAAPVLHLVNRVAEALASEFADRAIETLAYQWTRKPPRTMRPQPNVIIRLCSIECCFSHPLETCDSPTNHAFVEDLRGWARISNRLWVWNYETNFSHYLLPFPNYHVWADNIRFYAANHVRGIFTQDDYQSPHGELSALGGYVRAKLLWDPGSDAGAATDEFLAAVYGPAGPFIRQYMDLLSAKVRDENIHLRIYDPPVNVYLSDEVLRRAGELWDQAERSVISDRELLRRVRLARLSLDYAFIERARRGDILATHHIDHAGFTIGLEPSVSYRIERFFDLGRAAGITHLNEAGMTPNEYQKSLPALLRSPQLTQLRPALPVEVPSGKSPGLRYRLYRGGKEDFSSLESAKPVEEGISQGVGLVPRQKKSVSGGFALALSGLLHAPADGVYVFSLDCASHAVFSVAGQQLFTRDASTTGESFAYIALKAGLHPINLRLIHPASTGSEPQLSLTWQGPSIPRQAIPPEALSHAE